MSKNKDGTTNWVDLSCATGEWYTPRMILDRVDLFFGGQIPLDPCTSPANPTNAKIFWSDYNGEDGLEMDWCKEADKASTMSPYVPYGRGYGCFVNPPYGVKNRMPEWLEKIHDEAIELLPTIALLPMGSRFSTKNWQRWILSRTLDAICFVNKRVPFENARGEKQNRNPHDSAIYGYNVPQSLFKECFTPLGKCYDMRLMNDRP